MKEFAGRDQRDRIRDCYQLLEMTGLGMIGEIGPNIWNTFQKAKDELNVIGTLLFFFGVF